VGSERIEQEINETLMCGWFFPVLLPRDGSVWRFLIKRRPDAGKICSFFFFHVGFMLVVGFRLGLRMSFCSNQFMRRASTGVLLFRCLAIRVRSVEIKR